MTGVGWRSRRERTLNMHDHPRVEFAQISRPVTDALPLGLVVIDPQGDVVWANLGWSTLAASKIMPGTSLGIGDSYVDGVARYLSLDAEDAAQLVRDIDAARDHGRECDALDCSTHLAGESRRLFVTVLPLDVGGPPLVLVSHQDITTRKGREDELSLFRDAIAQTGEFVLIADHDGSILYANAAFTESSGVSSTEILGRSLWTRTGEPRDTATMDAVRTALRVGKTWREELQWRGEDGALRWESQTVSPILNRDGQVTHLVAVIRDITQQRAHLDELQRRAYYDGLTGLPNRMLFMDRLDHARMRVQRSMLPFAVMYIDLTEFKSVNDRFGHGMGNQVLAAVARRLGDCLRASDTVARAGGDEFIILLEELATEEDAIAVARRIVEEVSRPLEIDHTLISVSGSVGIAFNTPAISEPEILLELADIALYHAKGMTGSRFVIYRENMTMPSGSRHSPDGDPSSS